MSDSSSLPAAAVMGSLLSVSPLQPVADLKRSIAFYTEKLGFQIDHQEEIFAILSRDGVTLFLSQKQKDVDLRNAQTRNQADGLVSYDLHIHCRPGTLDSLWKEFRNRGVSMPKEFDKGPIKRDYSVRDFSVFDPDEYDIVFGESTNARS